MQIVVESDRDRRVLEWFVEQVGENPLAAACINLAGRRCAFPSSGAKALGLSSPRPLALTSPESAAVHTATITKLLGVPHGYP